MFVLFENIRKLLIAHQKLKEGSLKKHVDKSPRKTDLTFECKSFFKVTMQGQALIQCQAKTNQLAHHKDTPRRSSEPIKTQSKYR